MHDDLFTAADLRQMEALGISAEEAARQVELFRNPPPYIRILRPCRIGDGIRQLVPSDHEEVLSVFADAASSGRIGKFVPASGAATRMFQTLLAHLNGGGAETADEIRTFFDNLPQFAFHDDLLAEVARQGNSMEDQDAVLRALLFEPGLGYADKPKGLLKFHRQGGETRTAFEEHLVETADTARDAAGTCRLHFTVSPRYQDAFVAHFEQVRPRTEERTGCRFQVTFSHQGRHTDTLAVDLEDWPFRQNDGTLLFRPGGHGSLITNLETLAGMGWDVVLLKNIDNVVPDARKAASVLWKKLLAGALLSLRDRISGLLARLEAGPAPLELLDEADKLLADDLLLQLPSDLILAGSEARRRALIDRLDRPLRVCGVVRNQGEPGGGPFWVEGPDGEISPQIVEISQIDPASPEQQGALQSAGYFNPTDLACAVRDRHNRPYDLQRFIDPSTVFIALKTHEGRPLKALERPGLWNGAMAGWNTVFVEVPDETFAPVKTVLDLLRPEHQG